MEADAKDQFLAICCKAPSDRSEEEQALVQQTHDGMAEDARQAQAAIEESQAEAQTELLEQETQAAERASDLKSLEERNVALKADVAAAEEALSLAESCVADA